MMGPKESQQSHFLIELGILKIHKMCVIVLISKWVGVGDVKYKRGVWGCEYRRGVWGV